MASDIDLLAAFGVFIPRIAWDAVLAQLTTRDLRDSRTCLRDLTELPGGQRLSVIDDNYTREALWSPWQFTDRRHRLTQMDDAVEVVGTVARKCIAARASQFGKVVLMLSGGLDSSIVAAGLVAAGIDVAALTLVTRDAIGDERHHAHRVADRLGIALSEGLREPSRVDIARSAASRLPRPTIRLFLQESMRLAGEVAHASGAQAIFNGGGGDNVFCSLQSASPAADRLRTSGPGRAFLKTASDIGTLAQASLPAVISAAIARALPGAAKFIPFRDISLLSRDAAANVEPADSHPWFNAPPGVLPGAAAHVRLIAFAQSYVEGLDPQAALPTVAPLLSQPLVETCLSVPSWLWCAGGRNRAVARAAFAADLPPETIARRSKGTPDSFVAEIFEAHRAAIREMLADGLLVRHGLIDRPALLAALADAGAVRGDTFRRILQFVDVEAWAQAMTGRGDAA